MTLSVLLLMVSKNGLDRSRLQLHFTDGVKSEVAVEKNDDVSAQRENRLRFVLTLQPRLPLDASRYTTTQDDQQGFLHRQGGVIFFDAGVKMLTHGCQNLT